MNIDEFSKSKKAKLDAEAREKRAGIAKAKAEKLKVLGKALKNREPSFS